MAHFKRFLLSWFLTFVYIFIGIGAAFLLTKLTNIPFTRIDAIMMIAIGAVWLHFDGYVQDRR